MIAYSLATQALGFGLDELRKPARDLLALIEQKVHELADTQAVRPTAVSFSRRDTRAWSGLPNHQVKGAMQELEELEYVEVQRAVRGSRFTYRLVSDDQKKRMPMAGLLTPVELFNRVTEAEQVSHGRRSGRGRSSKVENGPFPPPKSKQNRVKSKA